MRVIYIITIMIIIVVIVDVIITISISLITCLVQFRDSWVELVAEQRGRQMQVGANLSIIIIMIDDQTECPQYHNQNQSPQYHDHHLKTHSGEKSNIALGSQTFSQIIIM